MTLSATKESAIGFMSKSCVFGSQFMIRCLTWKDDGYDGFLENVLYHPISASPCHTCPKSSFMVGCCLMIGQRSPLVHITQQIIIRPVHYTGCLSVVQPFMYVQWHNGKHLSLQVGYYKRWFYAWPNYWKDRRITDVAREFDIAHSVVSRLWKSFKTTGMCSRRHGGGRLRSTTPAEDRYIVLSAKRNRRTTAQQHRTARLQWCREHHNWTEQDWACVLFSDESRFSLSSDCRRQLIWRESGTAYRPENIQEKDRYPTCSIMVWVGIMINGRKRLHVVANGTMTGQR
ncbi:uncharacterized protein TNCV_1345481 [Trichonephila clavipes]|nr:uncharacterized protein TNCV_1345481 [Trichonephila clavipes]